MAKRFTDTAKWDHSWFRKLTPKMKCAWIYLCDKCDHAGVWEADVEALSFNVGENVSIDELESVLHERLQAVSHDKYVITSFIEFQYGELNDSNRVHHSVINRLKKVGAKKVLTSPLQGAKDKDKEKDKEKDKDKNKEDSKNLKNEIEKIYKDIYPRKIGKEKGILSLAKSLQANETVEDIRRAALRYKNTVEASKTESKYIKHFSTWANEWRDWLDENAGTSTISSKNYANETDVDHDAELKEMWGAS